MKTNMFSTWVQVKKKLFEARPGVDPTRQKVMVVLVPALAIVLIVVLFYVFNNGPGSAAAGETEQSRANTNAAGGINWEIPEPYPVSLRDPMQITSLSTTQTKEKKPQTEQIVVKSILYSQSNPSAVIGSEIVHQGDRVLGATVVKINENAVEFEKDGKMWTQTVLR